MSTLKLLSCFRRNVCQYGHHQQFQLRTAAVSFLLGNGAIAPTRCFANYSTPAVPVRRWPHSSQNRTTITRLPQLFPSLVPPNLSYFGYCAYSTKFSPDVKHKLHKKAQNPSAAVSEPDIFGDTSNLGLFAKFKLMYKKYWYVLIPVHVVTSIGWLGGFYYLSQSGIDIPALLTQLHISDSIIAKAQHSSMGHLAIAYLLYKVATPLRYAVTLGGTTYSIKYLVMAGYIKPLPTKREIVRLYHQKKADRVAAKAGKTEPNVRQDDKK